MARSNPRRKHRDKSPAVTTILHHSKMDLLSGSRTGDSIVEGTKFNKFEWYESHDLVRKVVFDKGKSHTAALFNAYKDLLAELYTGATREDIAWDYLKLDVPNKRAVDRVMKDGTWTPRTIFEDLPRSMRMFLRCRYVADDSKDREPSSSEAEEDGSMLEDDEDLEETPDPKTLSRTKFATNPGSPESEDELSLAVATRYFFPLPRPGQIAD